MENKNKPLKAGDWKAQTMEKAKQYEKFLTKLDKNKALALLPALEEEAYRATDCLTCAACCKNYSPRFKVPDIKRISKHLKLKESVFIDTYLTLDKEGDYVTQQQPCPFLGSDNHCQVYEERPSDCRRFPYVGEDVFLKRKSITLKNVTFCPIALHVLEGLMENS